MRFSKLIGTIKKRSEFFLGERDLSYLMRFLAGYQYSNGVRETEQGNPSIGEDADFESFKVWVLEKYNVNSNHGIERVINYNSMSREEAFNTFFELWDEYESTSSS